MSTKNNAIDHIAEMINERDASGDYDECCHLAIDIINYLAEIYDDMQKSHDDAKH